jgi:hypothetical protein
MNVFAYGVQLIKLPETRENRRNCMDMKLYPAQHLHYWIDENLRHQTEVKDHPYLPDGIGWIRRPGISVDLRGPWNYMIERKGV